MEKLGKEQAALSSVQNDRVKQWTQLLDRKGRDKQGRFLIEGIHLAEEALRSDVPPEVLIYSAERAEASLRLRKEAAALGIECVAVTESVLAKCTDTETPQPVFCVVPKLPWRPADLLAASEKGGLVAVIDGMQDPGNLGTIIRSADAVGASGILLGKGTVDLYNPKTVRSTMGSLFHLPIVQGDLQEWLPQAASRGVNVVSTRLEEAVSIYEYDFRQPTWFVIGNEGQGVSATVQQLARHHVRIPMQGSAESLNAAMAATVVLFEAMRQRGN
ncbi:TrmH family RNA methyltransferase [Paenibacillus allorhizosphaerae]|uniref:23S rRNA (Uridine(2479)-2'-O)-methyltransferase n=1 Tax=Paenibacillus allorhizosphaerae TaxID=2849866 RepID=A0ABN7TSF9_9BACL|nr:RNA methyltransferase [Paenibacillus allorhizosphaerae]CAG7649050.1 23S rRNA (uridine(2479)-2'-O)-methyltransferase [Paenibacillus allorhizosphaerae]